MLLRYCDVPFTVLRQAPLNLVYDDLVVIRVLATNKIGSGPQCEPNIIGVRIQTEPITPPDSPEITEYSEYSVKLFFTILEGDQTGGSDILFYDLAWDLGTSGQQWETYSLMQETEGSQKIETTINGLSSGVNY